ncbi:MAG: zinc ABC transporter solute-binding protein [Verrucomicrobia bacterium]|jgi:manganese/zinc/iron transport system substrate-binding protein|nr:zinc ABC transporter solute-binding protein [Verrucomicrobiota bacterium]
MNFYNTVLRLVSAILMMIIPTACGPDPASGEADSAVEASYQVVGTVGMITDVVRNVVGEHAGVEGLIGEGVDPHLYKPTRKDVVTLNQADVVFYNGLRLEGAMTDVLNRLAETGKPVRAVTEAILDESDYLLETEDGSAHTDPHVWMDVAGWMRALPVIVDTLSAFDPENADVYQRNAEVYLEKLRGLDAYAKEAIATIPPEKRVLVTAHDAFQYFGRAYGLEVRGIQGISTESEAGVRDLEELIDFIVERELPAVFVESSVGDKNVRALIEGARARGHTVQIGGTLYSDAMGPGGTYEGTYIGMIDHNVTTITRALGGEAPGFLQ